MKIRLAVILLGISLLPACSIRGKLYPVQGPLAAQTPVPVFTAKASGMFNSGNISVVLADGEVCKGRWHEGQTIPSPTLSSAHSSPPASLSSEWDTVYGSGFYVAHVLGSKLFAHGEAYGNRGTTLYMEMYRADPGGGSPPVIRGVAKDNKGNIYKMVF